MIQHYNNLYEILIDFQEKLEEFISVVPDSAEMYKRKLSIKRAWEKSQRLVNELGKFISPVTELDVKLPDKFNSDKFIEAWKFWRDYLEEQHAIKMKSRMEIKSLKLLLELSNKDPELAIKYLDYASARGSKSFYKIDDSTTKSNTKDGYDPDFTKKGF